MKTTADPIHLLDALKGLPTSFLDRHDTSLRRAANLLGQGKGAEAARLLASLHLLGFDCVGKAENEGWPPSFIGLLKERAGEPIATILVDFVLDRKGEAERLWVVAQTHLGNRDSLDIPIVDACLALLKCIVKGQEVRNFWAFLSGVTKKRAITRFRWHNCRPATVLDTSGDFFPGPSTDPSEEVASQEFLAMANKAIESSLNPEQWQVYQLRVNHGLSEAETAEILGVPGGTIKSRLSRARDQIIQILPKLGR